MANVRNKDSRKTEAECCKCNPLEGSKSDLKANKQGSPYLENAVSKIEERRNDLTSRQHDLMEKITTMERSIPALMAFNMLSSENNVDDGALCKIKQLMKKSSSLPDPTERLLDSLKKTVESLNAETDELHDKIIAADIKLEETDMELESLQLANKEFEERQKYLEKELKELNINRSASLDSIHSEDLICITKIRQLGEEEIKLKNSIRELEERESIFQEQINRILTARECQKSLCDDRANERKRVPCPMHARARSQQRTKKICSRKEKELAKSDDIKNPPSTGNPTSSKKNNSFKLADSQFAECSNTENEIRRENGGAEETPRRCPCPTATPLTCYDKSSCPATSSKIKPCKTKSSRKNSPFKNVHICSTCTKHQKSVKMTTKSCCSSLTTKSNVSRGQGCPPCCKNKSGISEPPSKQGNPSVTTKCCKNKSSCWLSAIVKSSRGMTCTKCQGKIVAQGASYREDSCEGKCAVGESDVPCICAEWSMDSSGDEGRKPPFDSTRADDRSSTDEEYTDCCDCGCEDSDFSDSCQC